MPAAVEAQLDTVVHEALAVQPFAQAGGVEQIHRALLQHASADPFLRVAPALGFDDHAFDTFEMQEVGEQETRGSGAHYPNLSPDCRGCLSFACAIIAYL